MPACRRIPKGAWEQSAFSSRAQLELSIGQTHLENEGKLSSKQIPKDLRSFLQSYVLQNEKVNKSTMSINQPPSTLSYINGKLVTRAIRKKYFFRKFPK